MPTLARAAAYWGFPVSGRAAPGWSLLRTSAVSPSATVLGFYCMLHFSERLGVEGIFVDTSPFGTPSSRCPAASLSIPLRRGTHDMGRALSPTAARLGPYRPTKLDKIKNLHS